MLLSSIFTAEFADCVPSPGEKESETKNARPTNPVNTGLSPFHTYNHYHFVNHMLP